jgi:hypothetical protein
MQIFAWTAPTHQILDQPDTDSGRGAQGPPPAVDGAEDRQPTTKPPVQDTIEDALAGVDRR